MTNSKPERFYDALIIGAGFSGLQQLHYLRDKLGMRVLLLEAADGVGGTWYWNRYPGAHCDSESHTYCFYFSDELLKEWKWSERYPSQKEIIKYLNFVTDRLDLRSNIRLKTRVLELFYSDKKKSWLSVCEDGDKFRSQFVISAVGCLSATNYPSIPGRDNFKGEVYHTGSWPHRDIYFEGKNVGIVGTGSSGIQAIPIIAETATKLTVFQRTPNYSIPARNTALKEKFFDEFKQNITHFRSQMRAARHGHPWLAPNISVAGTPKSHRDNILNKAWDAGGLRFRESFGDTLTNLKSNKLMANFIRKKIRKIVKNKETAKILTNFDHPFGTKRPALDTNYYQTFNKEHVDLIDIRENPIQEITPSGISTLMQQINLDMIIFATGFDAITGSILRMNICGKRGVSLAECWKAGPQTYLGLQVFGFPNLFFITGPGSPSVLTNMPQSIDQNVSWITSCLSYMKSKKISTIEANKKAMDEWMEHVRDTAAKTLFLKADHSWYLGANVSEKPKVFMPYAGGLNSYRKICDKIAQNNYEGFSFA